jgi:hypothetical protein
MPAGFPEPEHEPSGAVIPATGSNLLEMGHHQAQQSETITAVEPTSQQCCFSGILMVESNLKAAGSWPHAIVEQNKKGKVSVKGRVRAASARARWAATY